MSGGSRPYRLFEVFGIEIEYIVADSRSLEVLPWVDRALESLAASSPRGLPVCGPVEWSNELAAHVMEAKCSAPVPSLFRLLEPWKQAVASLESLLAPSGACLLPSAVHPWMNPATDARIWPHEGHEIYAVYDRIFGCVTHGWTNLQSVHLNLPFGDDEEFGRLHAAVRVALPLIPALAAASPYLDGRFTGWMDARMEAYRVNSARIPSMTGLLIPEPVFTEEAYREIILSRIYAESAPLDPQGILRDEWANARGAIARFDRGAIEIRVIDSQECPLADFAVAEAVATLVRLLTEERFASTPLQKRWDTRRLRDLLCRAVRHADQAVMADEEYASLFGCSAPVTFGEIWRQLLKLPEFQSSGFEPCYRLYRQQGPLARRLVARAGLDPSREALVANLRSLRHCLQTDSLFLA